MSHNGIILALQFWEGDWQRAQRLARLLADLEPKYRDDVALYFCTDEKTAGKVGIIPTMQYCERKFPVGSFEGKWVNGYPAGPNALWAGCMQFFYQQWAAGRIRFESVFTFEPDGAPLRIDWINEIKKAHRETLDGGKLITGAVIDRHIFPHPNGNLVGHVSLIRNFPELLDTPPKAAWDMHHHVTLRRLTRSDGVIRSEHRSSNWSKESLAAMAKWAAWLHGCRDDSAFRFACSMAPKKAVAKPAPAPKPAPRAPVLDFVMGSFPRDYPWLKYLWRSIDKYAAGTFRRVILILEAQDRPPKNLPPYVTVQRCRRYRGTGVDGYAGWAIEAMKACEFSDADVFGFLESDTPFVRDFRRYDWLRPHLLTLGWDRLGKGESGVCDPTAIMWKKTTEVLLRMSSPKHTMVRPLFIYPREVLAKTWELTGGEAFLRDHVIHTSNFSMYDLLGTVALKHFRTRFRVLDVEADRAKVPQMYVRHYWGMRNPEKPEVRKLLRKDGLL